jgi:hypothetical protein
MNKGVVLGITPFIATIAVPQKKNGAINSNGAKGDRAETSLESMNQMIVEIII